MRQTANESLVESMCEIRISKGMQQFRFEVIGDIIRDWMINVQQHELHETAASE